MVIYVSRLVDCIVFMIGSFYFVAGSYPLRDSDDNPVYLDTTPRNNIRPLNTLHTEDATKPNYADRGSHQSPTGGRDKNKTSQFRSPTVDHSDIYPNLKSPHFSPSNAKNTNQIRNNNTQSHQNNNQNNTNKSRFQRTHSVDEAEEQRLYDERQLQMYMHEGSEEGDDQHHDMSMQDDANVEFVHYRR